MRGLDDSLFRLKQITRDNNRARYSNSKQSRSSEAKTQNRTWIVQSKTKGKPFDIDEGKETNRPSHDSSCVNHYPISCVSDNWEIIQCYIKLEPGIQVDKKRVRSSVDGLNRQVDDVPIFNESRACTDFEVHLEHIR